MQYNRRVFIQSTVSVTLIPNVTALAATDAVKRYVRFRKDGRVAYGLLQDKSIQVLDGNLFHKPQLTNKTYPLDEVKLLFPCIPTKILATAGNYASHRGDSVKPKNPELFIKVPSSLLDPEEKIVIPPGTNDVHYEGELVAVIGKEAKNVSVEAARECIFGVTCGNDVSARDWQQNDIQWWRAKASDTFSPLGPVIAVGANYSDLLLTTRLNGEVKQQQRTCDLIFDLPALVSFASQHMTLFPGDLLFSGTPGQTSAMKSGDVVEVEIESIGILKNTIA